MARKAPGMAQEKEGEYINEGINLPNKSEGIAFDFGYDDELFKGVSNETRIAFFESSPRFFTQGWFSNTSFIIDTIWGAENVEGFGKVSVTPLTPKLWKSDAPIVLANRSEDDAEPSAYWPFLCE